VGGGQCRVSVAIWRMATTTITRDEGNCAGLPSMRIRWSGMPRDFVWWGELLLMRVRVGVRRNNGDDRRRQYVSATCEQLCSTPNLFA
jgi:hypothetical protein